MKTTEGGGEAVDDGPPPPDVGTRDVRAEIAVAAFVMLLGAGFVVVAQDIREGSIPDTLTARGLPMLVGGILIVLGAIPLVRGVRAWARIRPDGVQVSSEGSDDEAGFVSSFPRVILFLIITLGWTWLVDIVGHFIATPLALIAAMLAMGTRSLVKLAAVSLGFTIVSWLLFNNLLTIPLPLGIFEEVARESGLIG